MTPLPPSPATTPVPRPVPPRREVCLGLALGTREVGHVITTREHLKHFGVLNIRKLHSQESKESRFRQMVERHLSRYPLTVVALVEPIPEHSDHPLIVAMRTWLTQRCVTAGLHLLECHDRQLVKSWPSQTLQPKATYRALAQHLAARHPQLRPLLPAGADGVHGELVPAAVARPPVMPSAKERYWARVFLALAAAHRTLDNRLLDQDRPPQPPDPQLHPLHL